jgi:transcriptional regulator with XRE-family HTH domain
MTETLLHDDPQTVARLDSVACLLEWMRSMPAQDRKRFWGALAECSDAVQEIVVTLLQVVKDPRTTVIERKRALMTIADALFLNPDEQDGEYGMDLAASEPYAASKVPALAREVQKMNAQEASFAQRLRELMEAKCISQQELAERVGCSQPAISQMLRRMCRPQKKTILKLAEALNVQARELWPDIDVVDMLDAVASFQQDDYTMTDAEARALADASNKNRPKVRVKSLPPRASTTKDNR